MTSTNDGKDVKSNDTSGPKGKSYYIELYKSLESRLSAGEQGSERTQSLCEAWRSVHALCKHSEPITQLHLVDWLQRHTARVILQAKWRLPERKDEHTALSAAIESFAAECSGVQDAEAWAGALAARGRWFRAALGQPWAHPVLKALSNPSADPPTDLEVLSWLKEERGITFTMRLQTLVAEKCNDIALHLAAAVMGRARHQLLVVPDAEQAKESKENIKASLKSSPFGAKLTAEAGFTDNVWNLLTDIEFVLLHKLDSAQCIALAKQTPFCGSYQLVERLLNRLKTSPREKKLWKNAKDVAVVIAQVVITRCMLVPACGGCVSRALYSCWQALCRALGAALPASARLAAQAATAAHLHTLAHATLKYTQNEPSDSKLKPFVCAMYVHAITAGMNELEKLKLKTEKESEARSMEQTLASWFVQLGAVLSSERFNYECILTAFSLHPSTEMYDKIRAAPPMETTPVDPKDEVKVEPTGFGSWASDSRSQTNFVKTSETLNMKQTAHQANVLSTAILNEGAALGLSAVTCNDIAVLLSGPRVKTLSWDMDREELLSNCRTYMERTHGGTRCVTTELRYLKLDLQLYQHLPEEPDDEDDLYYGIEKGYEHNLIIPPDNDDELIDPEATESALSNYDNYDSDTVVPRRKKQVKRTQSSDGEEGDPLSHIAEVKRREKKKERPHSKERSKERKKKDKTINKESNQDGKDKPKEKKERKKKDKTLKTTSLSKLVGVKVANPQATNILTALTDSDYDSQGKSSFTSVNSEGNENDVVFDGLFSMDEIKSPERGLQNKTGLKENSDISANGKVAMKFGPPPPSQAINVNKTPVRVHKSVSDEVKKSITKLIDFRRNKSIETGQKLITQQKPPTAVKIHNAIMRPNIPIQTNISPKAVVIPEIPKTYINKQQSAKLAELRKEVNDILEQRKLAASMASPIGPSPVHYAHKGNTDSRYQQIYSSSIQQQSNSNMKMKDLVGVSQDRFPTMYDNTNNYFTDNDLIDRLVTKHVTDSSQQRDFQRFISERSNQPSTSYAQPSTKKEIKPINRVNPVIPKPRAKPGPKPQRAKQINQQKTPDHSLNTFSRLSYMHKNKQNDARNITTHSDSYKQPETGSKLDGFNASYLESSSKLTSEILDRNQVEQLFTHNRSPYQNVGQAPPSRDNTSTSVLQNPSPVKQSTHMDLQNSVIQNRHVPPNHHIQPNSNTSVFSEDDRNELVNIRRQQSKLNAFIPRLDSTNPQTVTSTSVAYNANTNVTYNSQTYSGTPSVAHHSLNTPTTNCQISIKQPVAKQYPSIQAMLQNPVTPSVSHQHLIGMKPRTPDKAIKIISSSIIKPAQAAQITTKVPPKVTKKNSPVVQDNVKIQEVNKVEIKRIVKPEPKGEKSESESDWKEVLNAILAHKTPKRGPDALAIALNNSSFEKEFENSINQNNNAKPIKTLSFYNDDEQLIKADKSKPNILSQHKQGTKSTAKSSRRSDVKTNKSVPKSAPKHEAAKVLNNVSNSEISQKRPSDAHKKTHIYRAPKEQDPFISGIHNSDYDLIEELMDDDLRKEIGELSSDEESYNNAASNFLKQNKTNEKRVTVVYNKSPPKMTQNIAEYSNSKSNAELPTQTQRKIGCNPKVSTHVIKTSNTASVHKPMPCLNAPRTTLNRQMAQSSQNQILLNSTADVNMYYNTLAQQTSVQNVIQVGNDLMYGGYPTNQAPIQTVTNMNQNTFMTVHTPNMALYQTTQFAAPIVNPVIIGNAVTMSTHNLLQATNAIQSQCTVNNVYNEQVTYNKSSNNTIGHFPDNLPKQQTVISHHNVYQTVPKIVQKQDVNARQNISHVPQSQEPARPVNDMEEKPKLQSSQFNPDNTKIQTIETNLNKTCERKVLSQVQDKFPAAENIDVKSKYVKNDHEKVSIVDIERVKKKRLAIINRKVTNISNGEAIPLSYSPIRPKDALEIDNHVVKEIKTTPSRENSEDSCIGKVESVSDTVKDSIESCKENKSEPMTCRRILLRSSNRIKPKSLGADQPTKPRSKRVRSDSNTLPNTDKTFPDNVESKETEADISNQSKPESNSVLKSSPKDDTIEKKHILPNEQNTPAKKKARNTKKIQNCKKVKTAIKNKNAKKLNIQKKGAKIKAVAKTNRNVKTIVDTAKCKEIINPDPVDNIDFEMELTGVKILKTTPNIDDCKVMEENEKTSKTEPTTGNSSECLKEAKVPELVIDQIEKNDSVAESVNTVSDNNNKKSTPEEKPKNIILDHETGVIKEVPIVFEKSMSKDAKQTTNKIIKSQQVIKSSDTSSAKIKSVGKKDSISEKSSVVQDMKATRTSKKVIEKVKSVPGLTIQKYDGGITQKIVRKQPKPKSIPKFNKPNKGFETSKPDKVPEITEKPKEVTIDDDDIEIVSEPEPSPKITNITLNHTNMTEIPQSYKDKIKIEHLPSDSSNPLEKSVRIRLPTGRVFKATVSGQLVNVDMLFEQPAIKSVLINSLKSTKKYVLNVKQVNTVSKNNPSIIFESKIKEIHRVVDSETIETINLLSDDEDEVPEAQEVMTKYGKYKMKPLDNNIFAKHQEKLNLHCYVSLKKLNEDECIVPKVQESTHKVEENSISNTPSLLEVQIDVLKDNVLKELGLKQDSEINPEENIDVLKDKLLEELQLNSTQMMDEQPNSDCVGNAKSNINEKYSDIINRKCFVKLIQCDFTKTHLRAKALTEANVDNNSEALVDLTLSDDSIDAYNFAPTPMSPTMDEEDLRANSPVIQIFDVIAALGHKRSRIDTCVPLMCDTETKHEMQQNQEITNATNEVNVQPTVTLLCEADIFETKQKINLLNKINFVTLSEETTIQEVEYRNVSKLINIVLDRLQNDSLIDELFDIKVQTINILKRKSGLVHVTSSPKVLKMSDNEEQLPKLDNSANDNDNLDDALDLMENDTLDLPIEKIPSQAQLNEHVSFKNSSDNNSELELCTSPSILETDFLSNSDIETPIDTSKYTNDDTQESTNITEENIQTEIHENTDEIVVTKNIETTDVEMLCENLDNNDVDSPEILSKCDLRFTDTAQVLSHDIQDLNRVLEESVVNQEIIEAKTDKTENNETTEIESLCETQDSCGATEILSICDKGTTMSADNIDSSDIVDRSLQSENQDITEEIFETNTTTDFGSQFEIQANNDKATSIDFAQDITDNTEDLTDVTEESIQLKNREMTKIIDFAEISKSTDFDSHCKVQDIKSPALISNCDNEIPMDIENDCTQDKLNILEDSIKSKNQENTDEMVHIDDIETTEVISQSDAQDDNADKTLLNIAESIRNCYQDQQPESQDITEVINITENNETTDVESQFELHDVNRVISPDFLCTCNIETPMNILQDRNDIIPKSIDDHSETILNTEHMEISEVECKIQDNINGKTTNVLEESAQQEHQAIAEHSITDVGTLFGDQNDNSAKLTDNNETLDDKHIQDNTEKSCEEISEISDHDYGRKNVKDDVIHHGGKIVNYPNDLLDVETSLDAVDDTSNKPGDEIESESTVKCYSNIESEDMSITMEVSVRNADENETVCLASPGNQIITKYLKITRKEGSDVVLKGIEYEDPEVGTCYMFPLQGVEESDGNVNDNDEQIMQIINKNDVSGELVNSDSEDLKIMLPNQTYTKNRKNKRKLLKRKRDMTDISKIVNKKYRKGKNIDYPKFTVASWTETVYSKEYKRLFDYCSSIKFSYSRPFHKECIDVVELVKCWPINDNANNDCVNIQNTSEDYLFAEEEEKPISDPMNQTLAQELVTEYDASQYKSIEIKETNFSMGFGEESGRVIQNLNTINDPKLSAATLSDVKHYQPFMLSETHAVKRNAKEQEDQHNTIMRHLNYIRLKEKVQSFFRQTSAELFYSSMNKNKNTIDDDLNHFPYGLTSSDFLQIPNVEVAVNVVQVGQLPVSASAQNPVTCDPRVTHVSNVSPSQCSAENSPGDDSQTSLKNEYTELTTANITLPLVQEYNQHHQASIENQDINSDGKIGLTEHNPQNNLNESRVNYESQTAPVSNNDRDMSYTYNEDANVPISSENNSHINHFSNIVNTTDDQKISEQYSEQQDNGSEKTDQIAHAMNAAGISPTTDNVNTTNADALVDIISQNAQSDVVTTTSSSSYSKSTPINAMALQQALAQILPPPLNQTGLSEGSQNTNPPVLHFVQGGNTQTVLSKQNGTPLLHILQNKSSTNGTPSSQANTFSGLSLVDAGLQGNQLLHIVNTNQKNSNTGQLIKRVNLLTNLANVQGSNEQKMVQFVCKSADGKSIQLNAPHQRSMVLRLQPIDPSTIQQAAPKTNDAQDLSPSNANNKDGQEIKSRSVYEENYAKFIQNGSSKSDQEKSTSLPKFNQVFGKQVYQDNKSELNNEGMSENSECTQGDNNVHLDQIRDIGSPPMLIRKPSTPQSTQASTNLVQQLKQTIAPMNIQTMHGGVIYTRQIPVNIGGGQTINLITVPSTERVDDSAQKQQSDGKFTQEGESQVIKIVQNQTTNSNNTSDDNNGQMGSTSEAPHNPPPQPVLTQMRIKLPMLSKNPQMVSGARVVRPSFFQIQRNVIGGTNPVYQQLVLTTATGLGQSIRLPAQTQPARPSKPPESQSSPESQMSSSTLEQLREFDMVLEQVKERSTVQPGSSNSSFSSMHSSTDATDSTAPSTSTSETPPALFPTGNGQALNISNFVNRKSTVTSASASSFVRSPDSSGIVESPSSSTHIPHTVTSETASSEASSQPKPKKKKPKTSTSSSSSSTAMKINTTPPKTSSSQKPLEDEQTTQRILYILAEYKEQVENSPDKDKPAPRRRNNLPPGTGSKRKKSSSGSRRRDMSPILGEDSCRTIGSEDSSCGTSLGECAECMESHSPQESPQKVVRKLTFEQETTTTITTTTTTHVTQTRTIPQRNVILADGQAITVARNTTGKPATTVLMPANYLLPVSMVKGGQQIAIVTNRGPKLLVGGGEGGTGGTLLFQRLIGPGGLKPMLTRPGVRHIRLPSTALHNLQTFNITTPATTVQPPDSTASPASALTPPDLVDTRAMSSPWPDREAQEGKPERGAASPEGSGPWNLPSSSIADDYGYEEIVRTDNMDRTVLDAIPDRYSPDMEAQRIFDKMFDVDTKKSMYDSRCGYDIDASDSDDRPYHQVVQRKDGRHHRLTHVSAAALRHKYAILEHELRLQKSLSEECEDLGVDSPSASELFPEAELLFAPSPAHEQTIDPCHTPQPTVLNQLDLDDQIATDHLLTHDHNRQDMDINLDDVGEIVTVGEDGMATLQLDHEEFARSHPNTTFHTEPEDGEIPPFTIAQGIKGRQITFHSSRVPGTVVMAPQTTVISQATVEPAGNQTVKFTDIDNMINAIPAPQQHQHNMPSVLVKDDGMSKFDVLLRETRENMNMQMSNTTPAIVHSSRQGAQVIRRVRYDDRRQQRYLVDDPPENIMDKAEDNRDLESMGGDASSPERHPELFWESNSASERSEGRRRIDFSSDSDKCCKSPYDEASTDSSAGVHTRLDSVIKAARTERSSDGSSDEHPPLRTYPARRPHPPILHEHQTGGKTRAGEHCQESNRRRASSRGVVKRGCHCCSGEPAPHKPKKSRQKKPEFTTTT